MSVIAWSCQIAPIRHVKCTLLKLFQIGNGGVERYAPEACVKSQQHGTIHRPVTERLRLHSAASCESLDIIGRCRVILETGGRQFSAYQHCISSYTWHTAFGHRYSMAGALEEANNDLTRTLKDLFSGAVGGVAQVLIGEHYVLCPLCIEMLT